MDPSKKIWHCELYKLQQQAPIPIVVKSNRKIVNRPAQYSDEYHGNVDRNESEEILSKYPSGGFLIRDSQRNVGSYILAIRFDQVNKYYVLHYDEEKRQHFVGSKSFDNIYDLVQDGLIHLYIESRGAEFLKKIAQAQEYADTPFYQSKLYTMQHEKTYQSQDNNYKRNNSSVSQNQKSGKSRNFSLTTQKTDEQSNCCDSNTIESSDKNSEQYLTLLKKKSSSVFTEEPSVTQPGQNSFHYSLRSKSNQRPQFLQSKSKASTNVSSNIAESSPYTQVFNYENTLSRDSMSTNEFNESETPTKDTSQSSPSSNRKLSHRILRLLDSRNSIIETQTNHFKQLEKNHNFKPHTFVAPQWCDFCAHFMWGLVAQGVQCFDCGFQAHKKCSDKVPADCFPVMKRMKRIFGIELTCLAKMENRPIPLVFEKLIQALEDRDLNTQGLYRISGNIDVIEDVKIDLDKDIESVNFKSDPRFKDIETLTGLIKLFLRQLPIPLITSELYTKMVTIRKLEEDKSIHHCQFREAMTILNSVHYATLEFFIRHLHKVSKLHHLNCMSSSNLAIVFAPTLICKPTISDSDSSPEVLILQIQADFKWDCILIQDLIDGCESIFPSVTINEN